MRRISFHPILLPFLIAIMLTVLMTSCGQLGQNIFVSDIDEISAPDNLVSGLDSSPNFLICPIIPNTSPTIPTGPYNEESGDCALRGKSEEIEAWLSELEQIAADCQANRESNWADTLAARDYLDTRIDELEISQDQMPDTSDDSEPSIYVEPMEASCPSYQRPLSDWGTIDSSSDPDTYYTSWLKRIGQNVEKYCRMVDELIEPLWLACDEINFYQNCQDPNPDQYHAIVQSMMNRAEINYTYTEFFYTQTLELYGWGNFRTSFNQTHLDCPPVQAISTTPKFSFYMNTFCRKGPSSEYEKVTTFLESQNVLIYGRNQGEPRWWWVLIPDTNEHCWISDATGSAEGLLEEVDLIAAPPPPIVQPEDCSQDLGQDSCEAAGGTWIEGGASSASYCDCP